jgi:heme A synthase
MKSSGIFSFALLVTAVALLDIVSGAVVTNSLALGTATATASGFSIISLAAHRHVSEAAGTLVAILAIWITVADKRVRARVFSWLAVACVVAEALLGQFSIPLTPQQVAAGTTDTVGFLHAFLAQLLFVFVVGAMVMSWPGWEQKPAQIPDKGWPSLRSLANGTEGALVLQVALGAAFRHNLLGVLWHILGAFLVVIYGLAMLVIVTQVPENRSLRAPAIWLGVLLGIQVSLGMVLISISDPGKHPMVSAITVGLHVLVGSSAVGLGVMMAMLVRRNVSVPVEATLA